MSRIPMTPPGADPILMNVSEYGGKCLAYAHYASNGNPESDDYKAAYAQCNSEWEAIASQVIALRADNAVLVDALEWARLYVRDASQRSIGEGIREEAARRLALIDAAIAKANGDAS